MPLCLPAFPLFGTFTTIPSATPAGILISTTSSPFTTPSPWQCVHLFFITVPSPPHTWQVVCVCIIPKMLCWVRISIPLPWQLGHVSVPLPPSAPVPWQCSQATSLRTLNFLVTPVATSCNESLTFRRKSAPLYLGA